MPNIEIRGSRIRGVYRPEVVAATKAKIKQIFSDWPCGKNMVVDVVDSDVENLAGEPQPYLRVWDTNADEGERVALRLRLEGFEVELPVKLAKFLSKPIYTAQEIQDELTRIFRYILCVTTGAFSIETARSGNFTPIRAFLKGRLGFAPYCNFSPPTDEELSKRIEVPDWDNPSEETSRLNFIRWHQMIAILGG